MKRFITLSKHLDGSPIYLNPCFVTAIVEDQFVSERVACVKTVGVGFTVRETPEQVLKMIEEFYNYD